ncbi:unnamed protein product [Prunus armeniaca]
MEVMGHRGGIHKVKRVVHGWCLQLSATGENYENPNILDCCTSRDKVLHRWEGNAKIMKDI